MQQGWKLVSTLIGWLYIFLWSISFYPQLILNYRRKAVTGLALDYPFLNVLGFACYSIYSVVFLSSTSVQKEYRHRNHNAEPLVRVNDAVFAVHALVLSLVTLSQAYFWGYHRARHQRVSVAAKIFFGSSVLVVLVLCLAAGLQAVPLGWIDVIYGMSYIKLLVSLFKCSPQLYLNYSRKSTVGWSITNILLDFAGGVLSLLQLIIDCAVVRDWSAITGNAVKTGLGLLAIFFDTLFMIQHYVLYRDRETKQGEADGAGEQESLLPGR